jgi:hypothetical protein
MLAPGNLQQTALAQRFLAQAKHKQEINVTNMCIMNAKSERRSDSRNIHAKITEFGVVVGKIRWFEV